MFTCVITHQSITRSLGVVRGGQWTLSIHSAYLLKSQSENKKLSWSVWIIINAPKNAESDISCWLTTTATINVKSTNNLINWPSLTDIIASVNTCFFVFYDWLLQVLLSWFWEYSNLIFHRIINKFNISWSSFYGETQKATCFNNFQNDILLQTVLCDWKNIVTQFSWSKHFCLNNFPMICLCRCFRIDIGNSEDW